MAVYRILSKYFQDWLSRKNIFGISMIGKRLSPKLKKAGYSNLPFFRLFDLPVTLL
jgi:hypothetical protein